VPVEHLSVAAVLSIRYYITVRVDHLTHGGFFLLSLAVHVALVPLAWRQRSSLPTNFEPISVSFLPPTKPAEPERTVTARPPPPPRQKELSRARPIKRPSSPAKVPNPVEPQREVQNLPAPADLASPAKRPLDTDERPSIVEARPQNQQANIQPETQPADAALIKPNESSGKPVTKERLLPGVRDLASYNRPIPLNTQDPVLAPFTKIIERWIEAQWQYPDLAKHYGLQGKVTVEFTVLQNGHIDLLAVVRSSGSNLLDEEAVRAIKAAAPFPPIPRSIAANRLRIIAGFTYLNNRFMMTNHP